MSCAGTREQAVGGRAVTTPTTIEQEIKKPVEEELKVLDRQARDMAEALQADRRMGDWQGRWMLDDGSDSGPVVAQVIALGDGKYRANFLDEFDQGMDPIAVIEGKLEGGKVSLAGEGQYADIDLSIQATIADGKLSGKFKGRGQGNEGIAGNIVMERTVRFSPTLGKKPPPGAVVLFDGTNFDKWKRAGKEGEVQWKLIDNAMEVKPGSGSIISIKEFADVELHLEFRTPFMPKARGQGRGNSGVYLQGRYEVQVLDSYGLEGKSNECGGIYGAAPPLVNMCAPPMQWQTYDITYRAARFDSSGKVKQKATMTVVHNNVEIHRNVPVSKATTAAPARGETHRGGVYLQDHGNPVRYRNIWLIEKKGD
jgi:hypothetical protein